MLGERERERVCILGIGNYSYYILNRKILSLSSYVVAVFFLQDNWSALLYSAKEGHLEIVIELLERGADIEHKDLV